MGKILAGKRDSNHNSKLQEYFTSNYKPLVIVAAVQAQHIQRL